MALLRLSTSLFTELREFFFVKVTQAATRTLALKTFRHLHSLSLRYHLDRRTGGCHARDRPGHSRNLFADQLHAVFDPADADRDHAWCFGYLLWTTRSGLPRSWHELRPSTSRSRFSDQLAHAMRRRWNELDSKAQSRAVDSACSTSKRSSTSATRTTRRAATTRRWRDSAAHGGAVAAVAERSECRPAGI